MNATGFCPFSSVIVQYLVARLDNRFRARFFAPIRWKPDPDIGGRSEAVPFSSNPKRSIYEKIFPLGFGIARTDCRGTHPIKSR
jgi:hypothetical protein